MRGFVAALRRFVISQRMAARTAFLLIVCAPAKSAENKILTGGFMRFKKSGIYLNIVSMILGMLSIAFYPGFTVIGITFSVEIFLTASGYTILAAIICAASCVILSSVSEKKLGHPPLMSFIGLMCSLAMFAHLIIVLIFVLFEEFQLFTAL